MKLAIKVVPGASRDQIVGWLGDSLKVIVSAKAEKGKANLAVEKLLAESLGLSHRQVRIVAGKTSSRKTVDLVGLTQAELKSKLAGP